MYNLLIVDDEAETREALCNYFPWGDLGFKIVGQMNNGMEALSYLNEHEVDVILTDIKMPVMDGIKLAEQLYHHKRSTKIVFLSGYREFEYAQQALQYKVSDYVLKPAKYHNLMDVFTRIKEEIEVTARTPLHVAAEDAEICQPGDENIVIQRVKAYVKEQYRDATLEEAAKQVHMNANYLSFLFKQKTGQNFSDYLIKTKMETAAMLLQSADYKTYEISDMLGYSNAKNFTRTFKNYYGKTPSEYRSGTFSL